MPVPAAAMLPPSVEPRTAIPAASGATTIAVISRTVASIVTRSSRAAAGIPPGSRNASSTSSATKPVAPAAAVPSTRFVADRATAPPAIEARTAGIRPRSPARPPASQATSTTSPPSSAQSAITRRM